MPYNLFVPQVFQMLLGFCKTSMSLKRKCISSMWVANSIAPTGMHILCIALRYNKPSKSENHEIILFITFF